MATRRMFSNRIANSARFLQMPVESQLLYFHLVLRADDDGIVETYPIIRLLGMMTNADSLKVLIVKGFVKHLNDDQVVVITDWIEHNRIRADRKVDSIYLGLLKTKFPELPVVVPQPRSDVENNERRVPSFSLNTTSERLERKDGQGSAARGPSVASLGKGREGKERLLEETSSSEKALKTTEIINHFAELKGISRLNRTIFNAFFSRNLRPAKLLLPYPIERTKRVMLYLKDHADFKWTLETVAKYIDEDLQELFNKQRKAKGEFRCTSGFWHKKGEICGHSVLMQNFER